MEIALAAGEGHAVVARENDERVFQSGAFLDDLQHPFEVAVHVFDLADVLGEILTHAGEVRQAAGDFDALRSRRIFSGIPGMMGIAKIHPEIIRLVRRTLVKKGLHRLRNVFLAAGIHIIKPLLEGLQVIFLKDPRRRARPACGAI